MTKVKALGSEGVALADSHKAAGRAILTMVLSGSCSVSGTF